MNWLDHISALRKLMPMQRYDFLSQLHEILKPRVYLEIGVQLGTSLNLAKSAELAIGVDPHPLIQAAGNQSIHSMPSDEYFSPSREPFRVVQAPDLVFIDGDHHYEQVVRDFFNVQRVGHANTIVAFDDVLPYSQLVGSRDMVEGDWAGDVWRAIPVMAEAQPTLTMTLVDVAPTGLLLVWDLDPFNGPSASDFARGVLPGDAVPVPEHVINRTYAVSADCALDLVREQKELNIHEN